MRLFLTCLLSVSLFILNAQDLISTGGDFFQMESGSISFTIGEPVIETLVTSGHSLTQGFQQSQREIITAANELDDISINIYPNPTVDNVRIELSEQRFLKYQLFDLNGLLLQQDNISHIQTTLSLANYYPSIYILKLTDSNLGSKTFQIVKK